MKKELDYLEIEICESCNLNCRSCSDGCNLTRVKQFYALDEYKNDLSRMSELFSNIQKLRLMGGEPFLNPDIAAYAEFARQFFPETDLRIVTNGLLIPKISDETLLALKNSNAFLDISNYPPTRKHKAEIVKKLQKVGLGYRFSPPINFFFKTMLDRPMETGEKSFKNCLFSHCHMLGHGKIAPCSYAYCAHRLNAAFGADYPEDDCFDIYSDITADEILDSFSHTHRFCAYCTPAMVPIRWKGGVTAGKAKLTDWTVKKDSPALSVLYPIQAFGRKAAFWLRDKTQKRK
ncbi:MAG: radical SAM protein [Clostridia bacterium]|nr:radical SAM protein [Clostridia bacterium]